MKQTSAMTPLTFILIAGLAGCATGTQTAKLAPPAQWGVQHATPGTRIALEKRGDTSFDGRHVVVYGMQADGFPQNKTYVIWSRWLNGKMLPLERVRSDHGGNLIAPGGMPLNKMSFNFRQMYKGEPIEIAIVSSDGMVKAFTGSIPFPLKAEAKAGCSLTMQMLAPVGRRFVIAGNGFQAGEEVATMSRMSDKGQGRKLKASDKGGFIGTIDADEPGKAGGPASFRAAGKACSVTLQYEWGTAMKKV